MFKNEAFGDYKPTNSQQKKGIGLKSLISSVSLGLVLTLQLAQAEDPLLGRIKAIKCVGCEPGKVTLVMHDPIEVRDFDITITDLDYGKIITPLPGKVVYEGENSCFYWNEMPKSPKPAPAQEKKVARVGSETANSTVSDSITAPPQPVEVKKSKCIPYFKSTAPKANPSN